jgi:tetratricopeptide (TPR) repeat protein
MPVARTFYLLLPFLLVFSGNSSHTSPLPVSNSDPVDLLTLKVRQAIKAGNPKLALDLADSAIKSAPGNPEYHFLKGRALQDLRSNTDALTSYSLSIYLDGKMAKSYINRALIKGSLRDLEGAMADLGVALKLEPKNQVALMNRGVTLAGLNQPAAAIRDFDRALNLDPAYGDAYRNRGIVKNYLGDRKGACDDWRRSASLGDQEVVLWQSELCESLAPVPTPRR